jgi:hypothetical protein
MALADAAGVKRAALQTLRTGAAPASPARIRLIDSSRRS